MLVSCAVQCIAQNCKSQLQQYSANVVRCAVRWFKDSTTIVQQHKAKADRETGTPRMSLPLPHSNICISTVPPFPLTVGPRVRTFSPFSQAGVHTCTLYTISIVRYAVSIVEYFYICPFKCYSGVLVPHENSVQARAQKYIA